MDPVVADPSFVQVEIAQEAEMEQKRMHDHDMRNSLRDPLAPLATSLNTQAWASGSSPVIRAENLSKIYHMGRTSVPALRNISFQVAR